MNIVPRIVNGIAYLNDIFSRIPNTFSRRFGYVLTRGLTRMQGANVRLMITLDRNQMLDGVGVRRAIHLRVVVIAEQQQVCEPVYFGAGKGRIEAWSSR